MEQSNKQTRNPRINDMLVKLNKMYDRENEVINKIKLLEIEYKQIQEDKELLQMMIMHQSNKFARVKQFIKKR